MGFFLEGVIKSIFTEGFLTFSKVTQKETLNFRK